MTIVAGFFGGASMRNFPSGERPLDNFRVGTGGLWNDGDRARLLLFRGNVELCRYCRLEPKRLIDQGKRAVWMNDGTVAFVVSPLERQGRF